MPYLDPEDLPSEHVAAVHMACALLLAYPQEDWSRCTDAVTDVLEELEAAAGNSVVLRDLRAFLAHAERSGQAELEAHYVATFDLKRRCSLHLSFYSSGDTRRRGMALVTFAEAFKAAGFEVDPAELPDHLPLVLEMSARGEAEVAGLLLATHRQGVELLRSALHQVSSPYAHVLDAVCRTLPAIDPEVTARITELLTAGPPSELVGIQQPLLPFPGVRSEA